MTSRHWSENPLRLAAFNVSQWLCRRMLATDGWRAAAWRFIVGICPAGRPE